MSLAISLAMSLCVGVAFWAAFGKYPLPFLGAVLGLWLLGQLAMAVLP